MSCLKTSLVFMGFFRLFLLKKPYYKTYMTHIYTIRQKLRHKTEVLPFFFIFVKTFFYIGFFLSRQTFSDICVL